MGQRTKQGLKRNTVLEEIPKCSGNLRACERSQGCPDPLPRSSEGSLAPVSLPTLYSYPWPPLTLIVLFLSPGIWSLLCPGLYCQKPSMTPVMVWLGRKECQYLILRHTSLFSSYREPKGLWPLSAVPGLRKIRPE